MFSGIVLTTGRLISLSKGKKSFLEIEVTNLPTLKIGDSIAVNGACLTLISRQRNRLRFDLSFETMTKTTFPSLKSGALLNIELPLTLQTMLSGHLVSGHIDGRARVIAIKKINNQTTISFEYTQSEWSNLIIPKGSIAINGVSLTIVEKTKHTFSVAIIPHTLQQTNLHCLRSGDEVNVELDLIAKHLYNFFLEIKNENHG